MRHLSLSLSRVLSTLPPVDDLGWKQKGDSSQVTAYFPSVFYDKYPSVMVASSHY